MRVDQPPGSARRLCAGLSVAAFLLGLWQLMSPVALGYGFTEPSAAVRDAVVAGAVVVVVATVGMMAPLDGRWPGPVLVLAGWWIAAVPWLTGVRPTDTAALGNALVTGCAVALLGIALAQVARVRR